MSTLALWGPPGSGKTTVVVRTAPRPLVVIDVDNKIGRMSNLVKELEDPNVIIVPVRTPLVQDSLQQRLRKLGSVHDLTKDATIATEPRGYIEIVGHINRVTSVPDSASSEEIAAGTIWPKWLNQDGELVDVATFFIDSGTRTLEHAKRFLLYHAKKGAMTLPGWGVWLTQLEEFFTVCCAMQPNFIISFHEKLDKDEDSGIILTLPSLEGQMATKMGSYFEEMMHTELELQGEKKSYKLRTVDTKMQCRTSHDLKPVVPSDLTKILAPLAQLQEMWRMERLREQQLAATQPFEP